MRVTTQVFDLRRDWLEIPARVLLNCIKTETRYNHARWQITRLHVMDGCGREKVRNYIVACDSGTLCLVTIRVKRKD